MGRNKRPSRAQISALWFKRQVKFSFDGLLFGLYLSNNSSKLFHGLIIWQARSFALELLQKVLAGHGLSCEVPSHGFFSDSLRAFLTTGRCWGACSWASSCPSSGRCRGYTRFFACWTSLFAWGTFLLVLVGRFFDFATKTQAIQEILLTRGTWNWSGTNGTTSKMLVCKILWKN